MNSYRKLSHLKEHIIIAEFTQEEFRIISKSIIIYGSKEDEVSEQLRNFMIYTGYIVLLR